MPAQGLPLYEVEEKSSRLGAVTTKAATPLTARMLPTSATAGPRPARASPTTRVPALADDQADMQRPRWGSIILCAGADTRGGMGAGLCAGAGVAKGRPEWARGGSVEVVELLPGRGAGTGARAGSREEAGGESGWRGGVG